MTSYAREHGIFDVKELALDLILHSKEFFVLVPNTDPDLFGEFLSAMSVQSAESKTRFREACKEFVLDVVPNDVQMREEMIRKTIARQEYELEHGSPFDGRT